MKLAVCQFAAGTDQAANTEQCAKMIVDAGATGADLAVLPEVSMYFDPRRRSGDPARGEALDGPFATAMAQAASAARVTVVVGMLEQAGPEEAAADPSRDYNTLLVLGPDGARLGSYRKIHLYDAFGFRESDIYVPGAIGDPVVFDVAGTKVGVVTCYDLRFPEVFRWVVDAGAEVMAVPAAWIAGPAKEQHWTTLLAARAIENTVYVAGAGQTGPVSCGQSMVLDPMGAVLAGAGAEPGIAMAEVDRARLTSVRATNPSLANRRFAVLPMGPDAAQSCGNGPGFGR